MEVDDFQTQVCKFRRVSSNGSTSTDNSSNYEKIGTDTGNLQVQNHVGDGGDGDGGGGGGGRGVGGGIGRIDGGLGRFCGWPSSRIVRVSRASGGKDRHSKVLTSKGLRDRRVRLSVGTAIQFYDLQDRLGFDQPSKAVEWLIKAASRSIDELPSLDPAFTVAVSDQHNHRNHQNHQNHQTSVEKKSPACSSTSETSKGNSELSLSRSENQIKARVKSRIKERDKVSKEKEIDSPRVTVTNQVGSIPESENSSFTDLLTGGINTVNIRSPMDNFFNRYNQTSPQLIQIPQFNVTTGDNHHNFSFLNDSFLPGVGNSGEGERHSLNFLMTSSSGNGGGAVAPGGFSRGTLQSNLQYHSPSTDGSTSANLPFFFVPNSTVEHFPATGGFHISYGGGADGGGRQPDHHREKAKN